MKLHSMNFHSLFPHAVVCTFDSKRSADAARTALNREGFGADRTVLLSGQAGLDWLDVDGAQHGRLARFVRWLQRTCSEGEEELFQHVQEALQAGNLVLMVQTNGKPEERERVRLALREQTSQTLFYCGTLAIEEIHPQ